MLRTALLVIVVLSFLVLFLWTVQGSNESGLESSGVDTAGVAAEDATMEDPGDSIGSETELAQVEEQPERATPKVIEQEPVEPEVEAEEELRYPGPDPVQTGECSLLLNFYDSVTDEPVSGKADLWRLDAPGNKHWTKGDQKQKRVKAEAGQVRIDNLPHGRYRVFTHFAREGADSAQEFSIAGELTTVSIPVELPQSEEAFLILVDASGQRISNPKGRKLEIRNQGYSTGLNRNLKPKWEVARSPLDANALGGMGLGGGHMGPSSRRWLPVDMGAQGISLGELRQNSRQRRRTYNRGFRVDSEFRTTVMVQISGPGNYVAILPSHRDIHDHLEFPADATRLDLMDELWLTVKAVPIDASIGETLSSQWGLSEVHIRISASEYKNVSVKWIPGKSPCPTFSSRAARGLESRAFSVQALFLPRGLPGFRLPTGCP